MAIHIQKKKLYLELSFGWDHWTFWTLSSHVHIHKNCLCLTATKESPAMAQVWSLHTQVRPTQSVLHHVPFHHTSRLSGSKNAQ